MGRPRGWCDVFSHTLFSDLRSQIVSSGHHRQSCPLPPHIPFLLWWTGTSQLCLNNFCLTYDHSGAQWLLFTKSVIVTQSGNYTLVIGCNCHKRQWVQFLWGSQKERQNGKATTGQMATGTHWGSTMHNHLGNVPLPPSLWKEAHGHVNSFTINQIRFSSGLLLIWLSTYHCYQQRGYYLSTEAALGSLQHTRTLYFPSAVFQKHQPTHSLTNTRN